jgi:hypothetical protein
MSSRRVERAKYLNTGHLDTWTLVKSLSSEICGPRARSGLGRDELMSCLGARPGRQSRKNTEYKNQVHIALGVGGEGD